MMVSSADDDNRAKKVRRIFEQFDMNTDGGLNRQEMTSLILAVNPRVKFTGEHINVILHEVYQEYHEFIDGEKGLNYEGLLKTYDDGEGDVDRDFNVLGLKLLNPPDNPSYVPISMSQIVEKLEVLIKRLKLKKDIAEDGRLLKEGNYLNICWYAGWSRELVPSLKLPVKRIRWEESGDEYETFLKELGALRKRVNGAGMLSKKEENKFDGHMTIGKVLYDHQLYKEAFVSFQRDCQLKPMGNW